MQQSPPQPEYIFRGHQDDVNNVHFFNDDKYIISCDASGIIIVWLFQTRRPLFQWKAHSAPCLSVHVYDQDKVVSQGRDNMIHVWQLDFNSNDSPRLVDSLPYDSITYCQLSLTKTNGDTMICFPSIASPFQMDIYNLTKRTWVIQNIGDQNNEQRRICMALQFMEQKYPIIDILAGYENGTMVLWQCHLETKNVRLVWQMHCHEKPVLCLIGSVIEGYALSGSLDNQVIKYDLTNGQIIKKIKTKKSGTASVALRKDNKIWATGGYDGNIRVYSVKTMKPLAILSYHRDSVYYVDFAKSWMIGQDNEQHWLVGCSKDHRISLWQIY
ncbi:WD40-repeat-containing domain protein [Halteromyces radiatus]|uniref:WD40-repeat-containing domain protein n=1 Tax=Halteromyces radiatus TaxID=101107 RepID=UPI00221E8837|nr:WD40-repeat-containing domain protein [Halteromyces radiatus]KAI8097264.1 WD40-repeat-containing domain protein [Halteromyces radiatus]